jgi:small-conductance mechanosensitive channel
MKRVFVVLLMSLLLLAVGGIGVANAQDDTPTPTPVSTKTAAVASATPTPTPIVTTTESSDALPTVTVFGLTLAQWLELVVSAVLVVLVAHYGGALIVRLLRRLTRRTETALDDALLSVIRPQVSWFVAAVGFQFATSRLAFTNETIDALLKNVYFVLYWFVFVATLWRTIDFLIQWYGEHLAPDADQALSEQALVLLQRLARIVLVIVGSMVLLAAFGIDVLAVSAALGLSGFAIALAAQDTISNIISGLVIMIDHPFSIGDRIDVPALGTWGDVVEIGMRTTKAVTRDNRLVIIPNTSIVDANVTNYSLPDPTYRLQTDIGIGSGESIPDIVRILTEAVRGVDGVLPDKNVDVLFTGFGDSSNTFRVRWWVATYADERRVTHQVCSAIQDVATKEGIDMPYTTYTLDNQVMILTKDGQKLGPAAVADLAEQMDQADGSE